MSAVFTRFHPILAALLLTAGPAYGCIVVDVPDGDTLTALCDGAKVTVDLAEIDAPELTQDFGRHSRQSLSDMCFRHSAQISGLEETEQGRFVGQVQCDGVLAGAEQLRRGMAWVSDEDANDKTLYVAQDIARHAGRGLWSGIAPIPPWEWRMAAAAQSEQRAKPGPKAVRAPQKEEPDNPIIGFFKRIFSK